MGSPVKLLPDYACRIDSDKRNLDKVGIKGIQIYRNDFTNQRVLTEQSAFVRLGSNNGAHMSRLVQNLVDAKDTPIEMDNEFLLELAESHDSNSVYWECKWRTEYEGEVSIMVDVGLEGTIIEGEICWYLTFKVPYASVCPCSHEMVKSMGDGIPHMQRCIMEVTGLLEGGELDWILSEGITRVIRAVQLIPENIMKRPDELEWCQRASRINLFVEDAARNVADEMDDLFGDWLVNAEHFESIHQHNVVAVCKKGDRLI